jgi:tol-pal system protein YbgF
MDSLDNTMTNLGGKLDDTKQRMSLLTQRMDDVDANLTQRIDILNTRLSPEELSPVTPSPSELYKYAYSDYSRGKYDIAINGFRAYIDEYPKSELAGNAQYYLGESYFKKKQYKMAVGEFDKFTDTYSHSDFVPSAKYKKALCQLKLNNKKYAKKILEYVIKEFPGSPEAKQAKNKLKSISSP